MLVSTDVYVYILKCSDNTFYTGITKNLDRRINEHEAGRASYTKKRLPVCLVYYAECEGYINARGLEKYIKNMGARKYLNKQQIIA